jgi:NhaA family Na+:H+ antiporter
VSGELASVRSSPALSLGVASLPVGVSWRLIQSCAWLGGRGFTLSLFLAGLAFEGTPSLDAAKVGVLSASVVAGAVGAVLLRRSVAAHR